MTEHSHPLKDEILPLLQKNRVRVILFVLLATAVIMGISRASSAHFGSDFHMYFSSGQHFAEGKPLYVNPESGAPYVYPPFAAFIFQTFNYLDEGSAVALGFFSNFLLTLLNLALVFGISRKLGWAKPQVGWAILGAFLLSFTDIWNNINFSQINPFLFFLTLSGIYAYIHEKQHWAMMLWTLGAWIKVLPIIFLIWGLIRDFRLKNLLYVVGISFLCLMLPVVQRGWLLGPQDLLDFYQQFLHVNMSGINIIWRNQSLSAALTRAFIPIQQLHFLDVPWSSHVVASSATWIKACSFAILCITFLTTSKKRQKQLPITMTEIALIFLTTHLFSGITWRGHLLTMLFSFLPLFLTFQLLGNRLKKMGVICIMVILALIFLIPQDFVGKETIQQIHQWSLVTWSLLGLYFLYLIIEIFEFKRSKP